MKFVLLLLKSIVLCNVAVMLTCCNAGMKQPEKNNITFDSLAVDKSYGIRDVETDPDCSLEIRFTYPTVSEDKEALEKIKQQFIISFFGDKYYQLSPENAATQYTEDYIQTFREEEKEYLANLENHDLHLEESWLVSNRSIHNEIVYNQNGLLSFVVNTSYSAGGAHEAHSVANCVVDVKTGQRISEKEIFVDGYKVELSRILVDEIVKTNHVKEAGELETIGFFDADEISPNENFYADDTGITYTFNEYEIAAYAVGAVSVRIAYEKIRHILHSEGTVANVAFR